MPHFLRFLRESALDLVAVACVTAFALLVWWPAALLVLAGAALFASWRRS